MLSWTVILLFFIFLRWKALNCKNYIIVLIFLYYAESRSLVKYDDCAFWELDTQNLMTGEKRGRRNIAISKISEMLVWMLCVHSGFPLIMNGCWNSLLTESAGSAAIVVPVQPAPRMLLCRHAAVYSTDPESVMGECSVRYDSERIR